MRVVAQCLTDSKISKNKKSSKSTSSSIHFMTYSAVTPEQMPEYLVALAWLLGQYDVHIDLESVWPEVEHRAKDELREMIAQRRILDPFGFVRDPVRSIATDFFYDALQEQVRRFRLERQREELFPEEDVNPDEEAAVLALLNEEAESRLEKEREYATQIMIMARQKRALGANSNAQSLAAATITINSDGENTEDEVVVVANNDVASQKSCKNSVNNHGGVSDPSPVRVSSPNGASYNHDHDDSSVPNHGSLLMAQVDAENPGSFQAEKIYSVLLLVGKKQYSLHNEKFNFSQEKEEEVFENHSDGEDNEMEISSNSDYSNGSTDDDEDDEDDFEVASNKGKSNRFNQRKVFLNDRGEHGGETNANNRSALNLPKVPDMEKWSRIQLELAYLSGESHVYWQLQPEGTPVPKVYNWPYIKRNATPEFLLMLKEGYREHSDRFLRDIVGFVVGRVDAKKAAFHRLRYEFEKTMNKEEIVAKFNAMMPLPGPKKHPRLPKSAYNDFMDNEFPLIFIELAEILEDIKQEYPDHHYETVYDWDYIDRVASDELREHVNTKRQHSCFPRSKLSTLVGRNRQLAFKMLRQRIREFRNSPVSTPLAPVTVKRIESAIRQKKKPVKDAAKYLRRRVAFLDEADIQLARILEDIRFKNPLAGKGVIWDFNYIQRHAPPELQARLNSARQRHGTFCSKKMKSFWKSNNGHKYNEIPLEERKRNHKAGLEFIKLRNMIRKLLLERRIEHMESNGLALPVADLSTSNSSGKKASMGEKKDVSISRKLPKIDDENKIVPGKTPHISDTGIDSEESFTDEEEMVKLKESSRGIKLTTTVKELAISWELYKQEEDNEGQPDWDIMEKIVSRPLRRLIVEKRSYRIFKDDPSLLLVPPDLRNGFERLRRAVRKDPEFYIPMLPETNNHWNANAPNQSDDYIRMRSEVETEDSKSSRSHIKKLDSPVETNNIMNAKAPHQIEDHTRKRSEVETEDSKSSRSHIKKLASLVETNNLMNAKAPHQLENHKRERSEVETEDSKSRRSHIKKLDSPETNNVMNAKALHQFEDHIRKRSDVETEDSKSSRSHIKKLDSPVETNNIMNAKAPHQIEDHTRKRSEVETEDSKSSRSHIKKLTSLVETNNLMNAKAPHQLENHKRERSEVETEDSKSSRSHIKKLASPVETSNPMNPRVPHQVENHKRERSDVETEDSKSSRSHIKKLASPVETSNPMNPRVPHQLEDHKRKRSEVETEDSKSSRSHIMKLASPVETNNPMNPRVPHQLEDRKRKRSEVETEDSKSSRSHIKKLASPVETNNPMNPRVPHQLEDHKRKRSDVETEDSKSSRSHIKKIASPVETSNPMNPRVPHQLEDRKRKRKVETEDSKSRRSHIKKQACLVSAGNQSLTDSSVSENSASPALMTRCGLEELADLLAMAHRKSKGWSYVEKRSSPLLCSLMQHAAQDEEYLDTPLRCLVPGHMWSDFQRLRQAAAQGRAKDDSDSDYDSATNQKVEAAIKKQRKKFQAFSKQMRDAFEKFEQDMLIQK